MPRTRRQTREEQKVNRICTLPSELLADILLRSRNPTTLDSITICSVCRVWNELVKADPSFWVDIRYLEGTKFNLCAFEAFLLRSKNAPIHVQVAQRQLAQLTRKHEAALLRTRKLRMEKLRVMLVAHWNRVRSFTYVGTPCSLIPGQIPVPQLREYIVYLYPSSEQASMPYLVEPNAPIETLHLGNSPECAFKNINPSLLRDVSIFGTWHRPSGLTFIALCSRLEKLYLHLEGTPGDVITSAFPIELHQLRNLWLLTRTDMVAKYFKSLPNLLHLSVLGRRSDPSEPHYPQSPRFGGDDSPETAWPIMPKLRTLTVDHAFADDLVPILSTSPDLVALHVHGNWGFTELFANLSMLSPNSFNEDHSLEDELALEIVPNLELLRVWPTGDFIAREEDDIEDPDMVVEALVQALEVREDLEVEIGVVENCDWEAAWDVDEIKDELRSSGASRQVRRRITIVNKIEMKFKDGQKVDHNALHEGIPSLPRLFSQP